MLGCRRHLAEQNFLTWERSFQLHHIDPLNRQPGFVFTADAGESVLRHGHTEPQRDEPDAVPDRQIAVPGGAQINVRLDNGWFARRHIDDIQQLDDLRVGGHVASVDPDRKRLVRLVTVNVHPQPMPTRFARAREHPPAVGAFLDQSARGRIAVERDPPAVR